MVKNEIIFWKYNHNYDNYFNCGNYLLYDCSLEKKEKKLIIGEDIFLSYLLGGDIYVQKQQQA